ncbi:MAG: EF-P lysine aminoacylase GenX [Desulfobulbaceae bacterium]|nr:EF-P lysine aminoacylase GenX [Desulfobulbaceae bacterium]
MISPEMLLRRAAIIRAVRGFFEERDYLEVDTPLRLPALAPERWIVPESSGALFLQTSPELCMKRLLAAGHPRIFQLCHCFRQGERGRLHLPEFQMLEWYRSGSDYLELMEECEELLWEVAEVCGLAGLVERSGTGISLEPPWERLTVAEAFARYAGLTPEAALAEGRFEEILVAKVEPHLGVAQPTFLYDYPAELAALARLKPGAPEVAERFELYVNGIELANGFSELTDQLEQRQRFARERALIVKDGRDPGPLPEAFLRELAGLSAAAGIALGMDRLVMLLAGANDLSEVVSFGPEELL